MPLVHPVILSGGVGSRLWPLSRSQSPKQLLALLGERSLIQETALRLQGQADPLIVCNVEHRFLIAEQMRNIAIHPRSIILESKGRNTAPAAAVAALEIARTDPGAILLLMPADHLIRDSSAFRAALVNAQAAAERGYLVTFGIKPTGPETGYGYIRRGPPSYEGAQSFSVSQFVEKPDHATAAAYLRRGDYDWNSGIFAFRADVFLAELERLEPDIVIRCEAALAKGDRQADFLRLDAQSFDACKSISIDHAVMERTKKAVVIPVDMGWSDIGSWKALWINSAKDGAGNVVHGDVLLHETKNSYVRSEGPTVAAVGIEDIVVVATQSGVLIASMAAAQDVRKIAEQLELDPPATDPGLVPRQ